VSNAELIQPAQKKGRKRKTTAVSDGSLLGSDSNTNITIVVNESVATNMNTFFTTTESQSKDQSKPEDQSVSNTVISDSIPAPDAKKRGRKPKGGKLVVKNALLEEAPQSLPNIILHLKCSLKDLDIYKTKQNKMISKTLNYNPEIPPDIMTYNVSDQTTNGLSYSSIDTPTTQINPTDLSKDVRNAAYLETSCIMNNYVCSKCNTSSAVSNNANSKDTHSDDNGHEISIKNITTKLKRLKVDLYKNSLLDKKSACFWCTYEFDSQVCVIPKYEMDGSICGYGSFCRPECAVAFLMKESIDDSTKFERYHLLNQIYSKVNDFKTNVKPAPDPHYLLDKFYGNLSIQEYRKLLNTEHIMMVIEKPLTRILPELHEDTDDFIIGIYGGTKGQGSTQSGGVYKVKRQSEKHSGPTKNSIMKDNFGLQQ